MKLLVKPSTVGFFTHIRIFLTTLIWGHLFKKISEVNKCDQCGKMLAKRRFELYIDRIDLAYSSEFDKQMCFNCAVKALSRYKYVRDL